MDLLGSIALAWLSTLAWIGGLSLAFGFLVAWMPCNRGMFWWKDRRAVVTDFFYWFVLPIFGTFCRMGLLIAGLLLLYGGKEPSFLPVKGWAIWQQCVAVLVIQDFLLYWIHRGFHSRSGWKFHAIHHSPTVLDWMSASRFHLVNHVLSFSVAEVVVLLLGFSPIAIVTLAPFNIIYSTMVHANLNWTFGPLKYVFASPVFHRWHHTTQEAGLDKNFASTFPVLDLMFGTYYLPEGVLPSEFGNGEAAFPTSFWGQFVYPFRELFSQPGGVFGIVRRRPLVVTMGTVALVLVVGRLYYLGMQAEQQEQAPSAQMPTVPVEPTVVQSLPVTPARVSPILCLAVAEDGQRIVSGGEDGKLKIWNAEGKELLRIDAHPRTIREVAISPDGKYLYSGSHDHTIQVRDMAGGNLLRTLQGHASYVLAMALSHNGKYLVSAGPDGVVKWWNAQDSSEGINLVQLPGAVTGVAVNATGDRIALASGMQVKVMDPIKKQDLFSLSGHSNLVYCVAMSGDGATLVTGSFDHTVKVWDGKTGLLRHTLKGHLQPVYSVVVSADGNWIASGSQDRTVRVWNVRTGQGTAILRGHMGDITRVAVNADGTQVYSTSRDGTMKIWEVRSPDAPLKQFPVSRVQSSVSQR